MNLSYYETSLLKTAYLVDGPDDGKPVLLIHGWPDDPRTFDRVAPALHRAGYRTYAPWLRGFGPTRFRLAKTPRTGQMVALAQDMLELADGLGLERFAVVGHDWGARIAYILAASHPQRVSRCAALSVPWNPGPIPPPPLVQAQAYWYQWFMATDLGAEVVRKQGITFARHQWDTWSRPGWYEEADFKAVCESFTHPDWPEVTLHAYRERWGEAESDPAYAALEERYQAIRSISVPTLMLQGLDDRCLLPSSSEDRAHFFAGPYERRTLEGVGHFPTREAPAEIGRLLLEFLAD